MGYVSDWRFRRLLVALFALLTAGALATPALAVPVSVMSSDLLTCDPLSVPYDVDELGNPPGFPPDEAIASSDVVTELTTCSPDLALSNVLVSITNLTTRSFTDVWYVSDPETSLSNVDGTVNSEEAFRIDSAISDPGGINHPLVAESITANDIFEPGETWDFLIIDYINGFGLPASAFASVGLVGSLSGGDTVSSGSIIVIPEPGTILLAGLGLAGLTLLGRKGLKD